MDLHRINVKIYLAEGSVPAPDTTFKVFNSWIQQADDELLIDVADYSHVPSGPVTLLVGHQANYSIDNHGDRLGLLYSHKAASEGDLSQRLTGAIGAALKACQRLENEPEFNNEVQFSGQELLLSSNDRLAAPNTEATFAALQPDLDGVLSRLYGGTGYSLKRDEDPAKLLTLHIAADGPQTVGDLLGNLDL